MVCQIPANPDISGVGVRGAIYAQNLLSLIPAFSALADGKVTSMELEAVEKQSTTILITAFAILISAIVQGVTFGLSSFHTSIILSLSWMNNTNTFIYFLLYIHHRSDPEREENRVQPLWSSWIKHVWVAIWREPLQLQKAESNMTSKDVPTDISDIDAEEVAKDNWGKKLFQGLRLLRSKTVLVLGSLHLTVMAAVGIWLWSSPLSYDEAEAKHLTGHPFVPYDELSIQCTYTVLLGQNVPLTSAPLRQVSLIIYSIFLAPVLNMLVPAAFFLFWFIQFGRTRNGSKHHEDHDKPESGSRHGHQHGRRITKFVQWGKARIPRRVRQDSKDSTLSRRIRTAIRRRATAPILAGLLFLLAINVIFITDTELTIHRATDKQNEESEWTFGQTLAILLLVLPVRDVIEYIRESSKIEYARRCTEDLLNAVMNDEPDAALRAAKHADDVNVYVNAEFPSAIQYAAFNGNISLVRVLLERNANINVEGQAHGSPLVTATSARHEDVARYILTSSKHNVIVDLPDKHGNTALHYAAEHGLEKTTQCLLEHGANPNALGDSGRAPLHLAALGGYVSVVQSLLRHCSDINQFDYAGRTILSYAVEWGNVPVVKLLLDHNANADRAGWGGKSPLRFASRNGDESLVQLLLEHGSKVDQADMMEGLTPLIEAAFRGHHRVVQRLLACRADIDKTDLRGRTPLHWAAEGAKESMVRRLLEGGASPDYAEAQGWTPLAMAAAQGHQPVLKALLDGHADVNKTDKRGVSPLLRATAYGDETIMRVLLDYGAYVDQAYDTDCTPLVVASHFGYESAVTMLLDHGSDINKTSASGHTPLTHAVMQGHASIVGLLLNRGADVHQPDSHGQTPLIHCIRCTFNGISNLLRYGARNSGGWTALVLAASKHRSITQFLLAHVVNVTPASAVASDYHSSDRQSRHEITRMLLEHGARVDQADYAGGTPISYATASGDDGIVNIMLAHIANGSVPTTSVGHNATTTSRDASDGGHTRAIGLQEGRGASSTRRHKPIAHVGYNPIYVHDEIEIDGTER